MIVFRSLSIVAGFALGLAVLTDVFLTTMHPDLEGPIAQRLQRGVWRAALLLGRRWSARRRGLLALAGPLMTVLTFVVWVGLFILAFALLVWPFLNTYQAEGELPGGSFIDALYYAGTTVTVLGYGDITPVGVPSRCWRSPRREPASRCLRASSLT